jgi:hypothetical protein
VTALQRAALGLALRPADVVALQRSVGNRAVGRLLARPDGGAVQRVVHNGQTERAREFTRIRLSGVYQGAAGIPGGQALVEQMHTSTRHFSIPDVEAALATHPLPTIADLELAKDNAAAAVRPKPNAAAKRRHKAKSREMRNLGVGRRIPINSKTWKGSKPRIVRKRHLARGARLTALSETLVEKLAKKNPVLKALIKHVQEAETGGHKRLQDLVQDRTVVTNVDGKSPTDRNDYLANTHVTLRDTDGRSSYAAFVRPDPGQGHGALHPLLNPSDPSLQVLNGVEVLRNDGRFALSLVMKSAALAEGSITIKEAVNPRKYGTAEISEVSGQDRGELESAVDANTDLIYEQRIGAHDALAMDVETLMDEEDNGLDTSATLGRVETEFEKRIKALTGVK